MTALADEWTDPFVGNFTRVPKAGFGVCDICYQFCTGQQRCNSCERSAIGSSHPLARVIPITMCPVSTQMHTVMRQYKDALTESTRHRFTWQLAALLSRFLRVHAGCLRGAAGAEWDAVVAVPPSNPRDGRHPVRDIALMVGALRPSLSAALTRTDVPLDRMEISDAAFVCNGDVAGKRVLLLDDTFVSGSNLQSAARTIRSAGAVSVLGLVLARYVDTGFSDHRERCEAQQSHPFDFEDCCLE